MKSLIFVVIDFNFSCPCSGYSSFRKNPGRNAHECGKNRLRTVAGPFAAARIPEGGLSVPGQLPRPIVFLLGQFIAMAFAQLKGRESLRDIESCLSSHREKLYPVGMRGKISRSTLADANERRDFRIYEAIGYSLVRTARKLYQTEELAV